MGQLFFKVLWCTYVKMKPFKSILINIFEESVIVVVLLTITTVVRSLFNFPSFEIFFYRPERNRFFCFDKSKVKKR